MTYSEEKLWEIKSSWIHPDGTIQVVRSENHDNEIPKICKTLENAEKTCVRVSCCWGYNAPISEIHLPRTISVQQSKVLVDMNESVGSDLIKTMVSHYWNSDVTWNEILNKS